MNGKAAVLVVFRNGRDGREVLFIRRTESPDDPWSGQVAFPGGHSEPGDASLLDTAMREAFEEVGLEANCIQGAPVPSGTHYTGNRRASTAVEVFVGSLRQGKEPALVAGPEVASLFWAPISRLKRERRGVTFAGSDGMVEEEGFVFDSDFVWGLTYRILSSILKSEEEKGRGHS
jgi:8-oxo-dGTP pyrophosphatase MutT (NUDIX family)